MSTKNSQAIGRLRNISSMFDNVKGPKTVVYATKGNVEIPLDLYLPREATRLPILLWFHGGTKVMASQPG